MSACPISQSTPGDLDTVYSQLLSWTAEVLCIYYHNAALKIICLFGQVAVICLVKASCYTPVSEGYSNLLCFGAAEGAGKQR